MTKIATEEMTIDDLTPQTNKLKSPQEHEERDGQAKECDEGKDKQKLGWDGQKDGLPLHYENLGMSPATEVLSSTARII